MESGDLKKDLRILGITLAICLAIGAGTALILKLRGKTEGATKGITEDQSREGSPRISEGALDAGVEDASRKPSQLYHAGALETEKEGTVYIHPESPDLRGTVSDWTKHLFFGKLQDQERARTALISIGPPAVPGLLRFFGKDPRFENEALYILERMGQRAQSAIPALLSVLKRESFQDAGARTLACVARDPPAECIDLCRHGNRSVRLNAVRTLGYMGLRGQAGVQVLQVLLSDKDAVCARAAAVALSTMGPGAVGALYQGLNGPHVAEVADGLALMGPQALSVLGALGLKLNHAQPMDEVCLRNAMIKISRVFHEQLPHLQLLARSGAEEVREAALVRLGQHPQIHDLIMPLLLESAQDASAAIRKAAVVALESMGGEDGRVISELRQMARADGDRSVRERAEQAIRVIELASSGAR